MELYFYYIKSDYINYLKHYEKAKRTFTCVPNANYWNTNKFMFGTVLEINGINYFVPVSSYSKKQEDVILMTDKNANNKAKQNKVLGSLRFTYMIPAPKDCIFKLDFDKIPTSNSRIHIAKELAFCRRNRDKIFRQAKKTYDRVVNKVSVELTRNACDFKLLEQAYKEYVANLPYYYRVTAKGVEQLQENGINFEVRPSSNQKGAFIVAVQNNDRQAVEQILNNLDNCNNLIK